MSMQQLNFEGEPFGEYGGSEGEDEFEQPRVRDHRGGGGAPVTLPGRPRVPGFGQSAAFRRGLAFGRGVSAGRGFGFRPGFGGGFGFRPGVGFRPGFGFGRRFGFGGGFGFAPRFGQFGFRRQFGFRPGFGFRRRRFPFLSRFGGFPTGFGGGVGFGGGGGASSSAQAPWVSWAQQCLAQIVGSWVPQHGAMDAATSRAIQTFQMQQQLPPTGTLDESTIAALQAACGGSEGNDGGDGGGGGGGE